MDKDDKKSLHIAVYLAVILARSPNGEVENVLTIAQQFADRAIQRYREPNL